MSARHAVIAGASGFIGRELVRELRSQGWRVTTLVRRTPAGPDDYRWDPAAGSLDSAILSGADAVINLAGSSISRMPWTAAIKKDILGSRMDATRTIVGAINSAAVTPKVLINASAVGIYSERGDEELTESSPRGTGFLADVVDAWEGAASAAKCRTVMVRTGLVLGNGGALTPLRLATLLGAGARVGSGKQWWPWISLRDEVRAIVHLIDSSVSGPVNFAGPKPATSETVTRSLAKTLKRPHWFAIPEWAIGLLGDAGRELLLTSNRVVPDVLLKDGFRFEHETVDAAIAAAVSGTSR